MSLQPIPWEGLLSALSSIPTTVTEKDLAEGSSGIQALQEQNARLRKLLDPVRKKMQSLSQGEDEGNGDASEEDISCDSVKGPVFQGTLKRVMLDTVERMKALSSELLNPPQDQRVYVFPMLGSSVCLPRSWEKTFSVGQYMEVSEHMSICEGIPLGLTVETDVGPTGVQFIQLNGASGETLEVALSLGSEAGPVRIVELRKSPHKWRLFEEEEEGAADPSLEWWSENVVINPSGHSMYVFHIRSGECYVVVVVSMPMGVHELVPAVDAILDVLRPALDSTLRLWPSTTCLQNLPVCSYLDGPLGVRLFWQGRFQSEIEASSKKGSEEVRIRLVDTMPAKLNPAPENKETPIVYWVAQRCQWAPGCEMVEEQAISLTHSLFPSCEGMQTLHAVQCREDQYEGSWILPPSCDGDCADSVEVSRTVTFFASYDASGDRMVWLLACVPTPCLESLSPSFPVMINSVRFKPPAEASPPPEHLTWMLPQGPLLLTLPETFTLGEDALLKFPVWTSPVEDGHITVEYISPKDFPLSPQDMELDPRILNLVCMHLLYTAAFHKEPLEDLASEEATSFSVPSLPCPVISTTFGPFPDGRCLVQMILYHKKHSVLCILRLLGPSLPPLLDLQQQLLKELSSHPQEL